MQITSPKRARHLDEYTQNVLEEETRYDDVDWLTLMMIYSGTGSFFNLNDKVRDSAFLNFNFASMASARRHTAVTPSTWPCERLRVARESRGRRATMSVPRRTRTTGPGRTRPSSIKRRSRIN